MSQTKPCFIDFNFITRIFPREVSKKVKQFGVLTSYENERYTLSEMNDIIAELIRKTPYIPNAMSITIRVMYNNEYHHILTFKNYNYKQQERIQDDNQEEIQFLYD